MKEITVGLGSRSYPILIDTNLIDRSPKHLLRFCSEGRAIVITDDQVAAAQGTRFQTALVDGGLSVDMIVLPHGEATKSWAHLSALIDKLLERGVDRSTSIIALGGGVIGDLVGFAASIIKRGCKFIQVPTTLLSQVDSSVGGKTAINTTAGKNLVGAFHQPALVLIDPSVLDTLPVRELKAGYAEVAKYGLLGDFNFFEWCELNAANLLSGDREAQLKAIETSVRTKAAIVEADERETEDKRALLNRSRLAWHWRLPLRPVRGYAQHRMPRGLCRT
jgi:3-dehydroquinate synthase